MINKQNKHSEIITAWALVVVQFRKGSMEPDIQVINEMVSRIAKESEDLEREVGRLDDYLEIYDVPEFIFELSVNDPEQVKLNHRIKDLSPDYQKLLHFIIQDFEAGNITQSMGLTDQTEYWIKRKNCLDVFLEENEELEGDLKSDINKVFQTYTLLRDSFLSITDSLSNEDTKKKGRRKWFVIGVISVLLPSLFFLIVFPRIIQKDFQVLFDYGVEKSGLIMTMDSTELLDDMIFEQEQHTPESYWLLALKSLREEDSESCKDQLKALKSVDRVMFNERGRYIYRRLR